MKKRNIKGSVLLASVDAFMATAAYGSYAAAGAELGVSATTVMRQMLALEGWLHRVLMTEQDLYLTQDGDDFVPAALEITNLIDKGGLRAEIRKTRVHADGAVTIGNELYRTPEALEISALLIKSRADLSSAKPAPARTSANDPLIVRFLEDHERKGTS